MMDDDDDAEWIVLVNGEGQHSLWPRPCACPAGWRAVGASGSRETCVAYVDEHWTDMRPLSLR